MSDRHSATHDQNARAWNAMARRQQRFAKPAKDDDFLNPLATVDGLNWLGGDIRGKRVLCLAAGGGRQSCLYAAAGAEVTVVDISSGMLELDRQVAAERGLDVRTVEASMDHLPMLEAASFDLVIHPVSTCYVPDVLPVFCEVARVTRPGGLYISQHKQPSSLQADQQPAADGLYRISEPCYRPTQDPLPAVEPSRLREAGTLEYVHRWEQLIGGICRAGFLIEDLVEPCHADPEAPVGDFSHRARFLPPYVRIKARRRGPPATSLLVPGS